MLLRYEATDMNIYRSALSACVIMGLPNVYDYIHKHRERLMEEKRQKILLSETARHGQHRTALPDVSKPTVMLALSSVTGIALSVSGWVYRTGSEMSLYGIR